MAETSTGQVEYKLAERETEGLEQIKEIDGLDDIEYLPGHQDKVGFFPLIESIPGQPVLARFSYGRFAPNMSNLYFDRSRGETEETGPTNRANFFKEQGFSQHGVQIKGKFDGTHPQIEEVNVDTLIHHNSVEGNMTITRDPRITLYIMPADCHTAVIYAKDAEGNPLVAVDHCGADAINAGVTLHGLQTLQDEYGVDLSKAIVVVFPGVSQKNFFITNEPERRGNGILEYNWGPFIRTKRTDDPSEKRYVNLLKAFERQAIQAGIKPENIQAYRRDTYEDARNGIAYSRRYSNEHEGAHPGANLLAVQIKATSGLYPKT